MATKTRKMMQETEARLMKMKIPDLQAMSRRNLQGNKRVLYRERLVVGIMIQAYGWKTYDAYMTCSD